MSQLFSGQDVTITCPCLDCGEPVEVRMRDGRITSLDPATSVGYAAQPLAQWGQAGWPDT
ncbi:MAG: organomercurial lyase [Dehalococcoidia bacterium]